MYWVNLDPTIGAEIEKTRPCVIISPDSANRSSPLIIAAPNHKIREKKIFSRGSSSWGEQPIYPTLRRLRSFSYAALIKKALSTATGIPSFRTDSRT
ncbi:type II toxin-antitoxin system PemK/MazF family toxin [uncultured Desulfosarcina sp.]|uniref:type II toxin-antitoxin system PemK/MazF family toxin n=1 Tax=uncultured Desulfosarcina sp. TaxID=218289 RepID=UPI003749EA72